MEQNTELPAIAPIELDTVNKPSPVEAQSLSLHGVSHSKDVVEVFNGDTVFYVKGWRLHLLKMSLALCMLLITVEVSIVGTSLVSITDGLHGFRQAGWVVTGYLVTYSSTIILWAKCSDIFGRKGAIMATMLIFVIFSGGCGASQTMSQLIINRAFQGIGAAGCWSMALVIAYEMVPKEDYPATAAELGAVSALGSLVGPLIGGAISERSTWRWAFLLSVPAGVITMVFLFMCLPTDFPHQGQPSYVAPTFRQKMSPRSLSRLDLSGAFLLLGATMLLVTVLLEAPNEFAWKSGTAIALLVVSAVLWSLFLVNERIVTSDKWRPEPLFPWRFFFNRVWMGTLSLSLLSCIPYNIILIDIPQRFQTVYGTTPFGAGLRLIPFNFSIALSGTLVNVIAAKTRIPPIYILLTGSILQLLGLALFSTLSDSLTIPSVIYAWEVLSGCGIGIVTGILLIIPPYVVEPHDLAIAIGAALQFRILGGALGLAFASSAMNSHLTSKLSSSIGATRLSAVLQSINSANSFPPQVQRLVLQALSSGYNLQMKILTGFASMQILAVGLLWRNKQISVVGDRVD